jgi:hypothetical protein
MGVDQPQCRAGRASGKREAGALRILAKTNKRAGRRAVGYNLVVLKSALPQANCKIQAPDPATPVRAIQARCFGLKCPVPRPISHLPPVVFFWHPGTPRAPEQAPHAPARADQPLARPSTAAAGSCRSYLCSRGGGPHTAPTPEAP